MFNSNFRGASLPLLAVAAGLGLALAGCGGGSTNLPTPGSNQGGLGTAGGTGGFQLGSNSIVFVSTRDGNPEIYSMNADGTNARRLTNNAASDGQPSRSPDGRRVAFTSNRDGNFEIYTINADGSGTPQRLTNDGGPADEAPRDTNPVFSPDGQKIVWQSTRGGVPRLYIMDATGANQRPVAFAGATEPSTDGSWNPDSTRLLGFVLTPNNSSTNDLSLITPAISDTGAATAQLLRAGTTAAHPRYSPNGERIVQSNAANTNQARLQLLTGSGDLTGDGPMGGVNQLNPSFSPDNNRLVWDASSTAGAGRQLYVASVTGSAAGTAITTDAQGENYEASWTQ